MMKSFSKLTVRATGFVLLFCLLAGMAFVSPINTKAQIGSAHDKGITITIDHVSRIDHGKRLKVDYTVQSSRQVNQNAGSPIENPHIWFGDSMVRGHSVFSKKTGPNIYKGTIVSPLHQYSTPGDQVTFYTYSILNQRGRWKVQFYLQGM